MVKIAPAGQTEIIEMLQKAESARSAKNYRSAIQICEKILAKDLDCAEAYEELADNLISLRQPRKAEKALRRALLIAPNSGKAHYLLGVVKSGLKQWLFAAHSLEKANQFISNNAEILRHLGWSIFHSGSEAEGLAVLERARNLDPTNEAILTDLGLCYLELGDSQKSATVFQSILRYNPTNQKIRKYLATLKE